MSLHLFLAAKNLRWLRIQTLAVTVGVFLLFLVTGCRPFEEQSLGTHTGVPQEGPLAEVVQVEYKAWTDYWFGGDEARAFRLILRNASSNRISNVRLSLDGYTNGLEGMLFHFGVVKGNRKLGRDNLDPDESLSFLFSHDTSNHSGFRNPAGQFLPSTNLPRVIVLESDQGVGRWLFP